MDKHLFTILIILFLIVLPFVLSSCSGDNTVEREDEVLREVVQYFEEPDILASTERDRTGERFTIIKKY